MYYAVIFAANLAAAIFLLVFYPLQLPVWGLFLALAIAVTFLVPIGVSRRPGLGQSMTDLLFPARSSRPLPTPYWA